MLSFILVMSFFAIYPSIFSSAFSATGPPSIFANSTCAAPSATTFSASSTFHGQVTVSTSNAAAATSSVFTPTWEYFSGTVGVTSTEGPQTIQITTATKIHGKTTYTGTLSLCETGGVSFTKTGTFTFAFMIAGATITSTTFTIVPGAVPAFPEGILLLFLLLPLMFFVARKKLIKK